jgi:hypothetical protein
VAIHLMSLRNVPADELDEIHALLEGHGIDVYETTAGNWGISLPALWLYDDSRFAEARALLDAYAAERQQRARREHEALKAAGKARTFVDIARENPLRFVLYLALAGAVAWFSLVPFLQLVGASP